VKLFSGDKASVLTLDVNPPDLSSYPSYNLTVEVEDGAFRGAVVTWVALDDLMAFVRQLEQCERTRRGTASLVSLSIDEFELRIESSDSLGHFVARYRLTCLSFLRDGQMAQTLSGGFNLDSGLFANLVREFAAFVSSLRSPNRR
jgi:hypothetical protein